MREYWPCIAHKFPPLMFAAAALSHHNNNSDQQPSSGVHISLSSSAMDLNLNDSDTTSDEDEDIVQNGVAHDDHHHHRHDDQAVSSDSNSSTCSDSDTEPTAGGEQGAGSSSGHAARSSSRTSHASSSHHYARHRQVSYDKTLPARHTYLGNDLEVLPGRVIQEENSCITIPLLSIEGVILVPGQLLPMQLQHPSFVSMMAKIVGTDRTFGLTSNTSTSGIGTTAEITSFSIENEDEGLPFVRIKAEGRNVFMVKETWRGVDGILMGRVNILPETTITHPFKHNCLNRATGFKHNERMLPAVTPIPSFVYQQYDPDMLMQRIMTHLENWASFERKSSCPTRATSTRAAAAAAPTPARNHAEFSPGTTPSPSSSTGAPPAVRRVVTKTVRMQEYLEEEDEDSHDEDVYVHVGEDEDENEDNDGGDEDDLEFEQIPSPEELRHELMADSKMDRCSVAPETPSEFSYWVAANLPLEDKQRIEFLSLTCSIQRLRWLLSLLQRYLFLCCAKCHTKICRKDDVFSMSVKGPQGTYVNSHGYMHETITVYKAESLSLQGDVSTEYSWFPGYAWSICNCADCRTHIGWKFTTTTDKSLKPEFFWGLSRKQIELGFKGETRENFRPVI